MKAEQILTKKEKRFVLIKPEIFLPARQVDQIKPKYRRSTYLALMSNVAVNKGEVDFENRNMLSWAGFLRNLELEKISIKDNSSGEIISPKEIADYNFAEMERATAMKWHYVLARLSKEEKFQKIKTHQANGRLQIALPGVNLGFEIGGILDFFNQQGVAVDIVGVDIDKAGAERKFMNLEERLTEQGSSVELHSETDVNDFFKEKQTDVVILRHPGPVFNLGNYGKWQKIVKTMLETKPQIVILSTYSHRIEDPQVRKEIGVSNENKIVVEDHVFEKWLFEEGYQGFSDSSWVADGRLKYPLSPYMNVAVPAKRKGMIQWDVEVDCIVSAYYRESE